MNQPRKTSQINVVIRARQENLVPVLLLTIIETKQSWVSRGIWPAPTSGCLGLNTGCVLQLPAMADSVMTAQIVGSLVPTPWETYIEFLIAGFGLA